MPKSISKERGIVLDVKKGKLTNLFIRIKTREEMSYISQHCTEVEVNFRSITDFLFCNRHSSSQLPFADFLLGSTGIETTGSTVCL
jgi:hypothetical protein